MIKIKSKKMENSILICLTLFFVILTSYLVYSSLNSSKNIGNQQVEALPSYTQVRDKIVVNGFKYENQPFLGDKDAKISVIEFADFKCPACRVWHAEVFPKFKKDYIDTGKVKFYFMNYAFLDRDSILAASAGEAIFSQNKNSFWEYYEKMFENQGPEKEIWATHDYLTNFVKENISGINHDTFESDLKNNTFLREVKEDYKIGGFYGVNGTPIFFVNDAIVRSTDYNELSLEIEQYIN